MGLLTDAAAPALQAAAPSNDPALAGSELLNRSLASASTQMQRLGPAWLERVHFDLSFDPAFQPRYALAVDSAPARELLSRHRDRPAGPRRPRRRRRDRRRSRAPLPRPLVRAGRHPGRPGRGRGPQSSRNSSATVSARSSVCARSRCARTCTTMFPRARPVGRSPSDGWMATIWRSVPRSRSCPGPGSWANRFWQIDMDGETVSTHDRVSLRLTPLAPLEIETGARDRGGRSLLVRPAPVVPAARRLRHQSSRRRHPGRMDEGRGVHRWRIAAQPGRHRMRGESRRRQARACRDHRSPRRSTNGPPR